MYFMSFPSTIKLAISKNLKRDKLYIMYCVFVNV